jgi:hypothetical protein
MLQRIARVVHMSVGGLAVLLALLHIFLVTMVSERPGELWLVGLAVLVPGAFMAASADRLGGGAVLATVALGLVSMVELNIYRATMPAVFGIAAGVDLLLLSLNLGRQRRWVGFGTALILMMVVVCVGGAIVDPQPIDP